MSRRLLTDNQEIEICKLYFKNQLTLLQVAERFQCNSATIWRAIHRQGLKPRTCSEAQIGKRGKLSNHWKGGKFIDVDGYIMVFAPSHPHCNICGYVREHRLIMEKHLRRYLKSGEIVHHINSIPDDNRIENLILFAGLKDHLVWHRKIKKETRLLQKDFYVES